MVAAASSGLGLAIAKELANEGCRLSICGRDPGPVGRSKCLRVWSLQTPHLMVTGSATEQREPVKQDVSSRFIQRGDRELNALKAHLQSTVLKLLDRNTSQREIQRLTGVDSKTI